MWAAVAMRGISKKMKVAAAQRVDRSLRAQQCSLVGAEGCCIGCIVYSDV